MNTNFWRYGYIGLWDEEEYGWKEREMDTKQIEYILKIAEERNITKAAEKLHITQPALNQQLLRLERSLGVPLFYRSRTDCRPTEAGEVYLENARKMLLIKQDTYRILEDMAVNQKNQLSIGFTPGRGVAMFSAVYPKFHQKYPNIMVIPHELSVKKQQPLIACGELDIGFQTICEEQKTMDDYIFIGQEEIYLCIPSRHPIAQAAGGIFGQELELRELCNEPFVLMYKESTIRQVLDDLFVQSGFIPNILFETANNATILAMIRNELCCGLIPAYYLQVSNLEGITCFSLPSHPKIELVASFRKKTYVTKAARYFVKLASEYWNGLSEICIGKE